MVGRTLQGLGRQDVRSAACEVVGGSERGLVAMKRDGTSGGEDKNRCETFDDGKGLKG